MRTLFSSIAVLFSMLPVHTFAQDIGASETFRARIQESVPVSCATEQEGCMKLTLLGVSGSFEGNTIEVTVSPNGFLGGNQKFQYTVGEQVIVESQNVDGMDHFFVADVVRTRSLSSLTILFILSVIVFGGVAAVRSFIGMAASFVLLFAVMLPAILQGYPPLLVSIVGGGCIMVITLVLSHGWNVKTWSALAGTIVSLCVTAILSLLYTKWTHLSGLADEEALILFQENMSLDTRGLLLAGIIIGTLGALDDITISQAASVFELKLANASLSAKELYKRAFRIGRDHIAAAVNTLVLAYAGASLPLLLLVISSPANESALTILNREVFATEIVRTLVGSIGLLLAVPVTTWIASTFAVRLPADKLPHAGEHGHHH